MNVTYNVTNTEIGMVIMKNRTMKQIHDLLGVDMERMRRITRYSGMMFGKYLIERAKVLDYIGVEWDPTTIGGNCKGQMSLPLDDMQ